MKYLVLTSLIALPLSGLAALDCSKYNNPQLKQSCLTLQQTANSTLQNTQKSFEKDYAEQQTLIENQIQAAELTPEEEAKMPLVPGATQTQASPPPITQPGNPQTQQQIPNPAPSTAQPVQPLTPSVSPYQPPEVTVPSGKPRRYY
jgi:hypothetical protein